MREEWRQNTLAGAIEDCQSAANELYEDMRDVFDRTPDVFKDTTGRPRELAADNLELASDLLMGVNIPIELQDEEVKWLKMRAGKNRQLFRPAQRNNVVRCLQACVARLSAVTQDDDISKAKDDVQGAVDILNAVYFPGMTGRRAA